MIRGSKFRQWISEFHLRREGLVLAAAFVAALAVQFIGPSTALAEDVSATAAEAEPAVAELTGAEIVERSSEREITKSEQKVRIVSRDPGGSEQLSAFALSAIDERGPDGEPTNGVRSRTRIDVSAPSDMRGTKYLIVGKHPGPNDEHVYQPSARRVRRVNLSATSFLGTDYTFGDFTPANASDSTHERLPDEVIDGEPVYVVESRVKEGVAAEYQRVIAYIEKQHFVPLRTRSFDEVDVEVKEMTAPLAKLRQFGDLWVASESTVRDLAQDTTSTLFIDELDTNPRFNGGTFSASRLTRGK